MLRVLVVDDDADLAEALAIRLTDAGCACEVACDGKAALALFEQTRFDVVISDMQMPRMGGLELLDRIRQSPRPIPVVLVSGSDGAAAALEHGAARYLRKPYDHEELIHFIQLEIASTSRPSVAAARAPDPIRGAAFVGPAMRRLLETLGRTARARSTVLLRGEGGTGKELVARALHAMGPRHGRAFVIVNASGVPEQLLESDLLGHARGAFTEATQERRGLFVEADGGTLMLDEVGDMPLDLQGKLLRVLQSGVVRPLGSDEVRAVDVRLIAATQRDLPDLVRRGLFRRDLFFRLNVMSVTVPSLRDRPEDVEPLAAHFLAAARERVPDSPVASIGRDAMAILRAAPWPGNVRELESVIERLVVVAKGKVAGRDDVFAALDRDSLDVAPASSTSTGASAVAPESLDHVIREHVATVLTHTRGNKSEAAKILGVNLSTLYRWGQPKGKKG